MKLGHQCNYHKGWVLYVKVIVGTFNQERALVGAFSMIVRYPQIFV